MAAPESAESADVAEFLARYPGEAELIRATGHGPLRMRYRTEQRIHTWMDPTAPEVVNIPIVACEVCNRSAGPDQEDRLRGFLTNGSECPGPLVPPPPQV